MDAATEHRAGPMNGHGRPLSRKGERTRARLIDAARGVFARDGFLDARVSDIASAAGVSQGSYYHYFESKEDIFREVALEQERRLTAAADPAERGANDGSVWAMIRYDNRLYLERYRDSAAIMGVIEQVSRYDEKVAEARLHTQRHFASRARSAVEAMQRAGHVDPQLDPTITADALSLMLRAFAEQWLVHRRDDYELDTVVDQLTRLCVNALGAPPRTDSRR